MIYLIGTKDEGLYFGVKMDFWLEAYPDANFVGLWGIEEPQVTRLRRGVGNGRKGFVEPNVRYPQFGRLFWG